MQGSPSGLIPRNGHGKLTFGCLLAAFMAAKAAPTVAADAAIPLHAPVVFLGFPTTDRGVHSAKYFGSSSRDVAGPRVAGKPRDNAAIGGLT